jgi:diaminohydroxyphosphoribosylaminopyrimidine deaminase/5-amino-6-(5-phosphoribosylamino)uracil reductase
LPYVRAKLAASLDGRTAMASGESRWITSQPARRDVQLLRARSSAILTGIGTLLADDPSMNVRLDAEELPGMEAGGRVRQPLRVVVDSRLRTPVNARMLDPPGRTLLACLPQGPTRIHELEAAGADVHVCTEGTGQVNLECLLRHLAGKEINEILVEAGPRLCGALLESHLVDEIVLYLAPHLMGDEARGLCRLPGLVRMSDRIALDIKDLRMVGQDLRITAFPRSGYRPS